MASYAKGTMSLRVYSVQQPWYITLDSQRGLFFIDWEQAHGEQEKKSSVNEVTEPVDFLLTLPFDDTRIWYHCLFAAFEHWPLSFNVGFLNLSVAHTCL